MRDEVRAVLIRHRAALMVLGAAACAACALVIVPAILAFHGQDNETGQALHRLAVYRAQAELQPVLETKLKEARERLTSVPGQISGTSAPLAQATLQSDVKALVDQNGGEIRSAQVVSATRQNGYEMIAVQYDLAVPLTHLLDLTYAIESNTPYLFVDDADISMPQSWQPGDAQMAEPKLEIRWTIRGYRWVGGK